MVLSHYLFFNYLTVFLGHCERKENSYRLLAISSCCGSKIQPRLKMHDGKKVSVLFTIPSAKHGHPRPSFVSFSISLVYFPHCRVMMGWIVKRTERIETKRASTGILKRSFQIFTSLGSESGLVNLLHQATAATFLTNKPMRGTNTIIQSCDKPNNRGRGRREGKRRYEGTL